MHNPLEQEMSISPLYDIAKQRYVVTVEFECAGTDLTNLASAPLAIAIHAFRQMFGNNAPLSALQEIRQHFKERK